MILSLLVAADEGNVIGKDNKLPWHLPNDLKYFKNQTWGLPVVMGRKTFDSIGKPLPGRRSIVLTRSTDWSHEGVIVAHGLDEAIAQAAQWQVNEVFVIGGAQLFAEALPRAQRIYLTRIHHRFEGDAYFPELTNEWTRVRSRDCAPDEKNQWAHTFEVWERHVL